MLDLLAGIAKNDAEKYAKFWGEFGKVLKEGVVEDAKNRESIARLLRYASSRSDGEVDVSLEDYVARMREGQEKIYYLTADRPETARSSPHLEAFAANDIEVLLMTDEVDEWVVHHLDEFDGKSLQSVAKGELDLRQIEGVEAPEDAAGDEAGHRELTEELARHLEARVSEVRTTRRLTSSPACLVAKDSDLGAHFERLLQAAGQSVEAARPVLEIQPFPSSAGAPCRREERVAEEGLGGAARRPGHPRRGRPPRRPQRLRESPERGPDRARRRAGEAGPAGEEEGEGQGQGPRPARFVEGGRIGGGRRAVRGRAGLGGRRRGRSGGEGLSTGPRLDQRPVRAPVGSANPSVDQQSRVFWEHARQAEEQLSSLRDYARWGASRFAEAGLHFGHGHADALDEAVALVLHALHLEPGPPSELWGARLTGAERRAVLSLFHRRIVERIPAAYLMGHAWFAGLRLRADRRALVPRSPLAEWIERGFAPWLEADAVARVLDIGTGSGCIAIACATFFPAAGSMRWTSMAMRSRLRERTCATTGSSAACSSSSRISSRESAASTISSSPIRPMSAGRSMSPCRPSTATSRSGDCARERTESS